jgi:hypothetical protein
MNQSIFKNTFVMGLFAAIAVVASDFLNAFVIHPEQGFSFNALLIAAAITVVGYSGKFLSGLTNTSVAVIGSALVTIVPLLSTGHVNWSLVAATFMIKVLGLFTAGASEPLKK